MLTTISKMFDFDAAHRLDRLPKDHKCHRMHGHTYRVEIRLRGEPGRHLGMLVDFAAISAAWAPIHDALDHRTLNEIEGLEIPTAELLAAWIYERLLGYRVELRTTEDGVENVEWVSFDGLSLGVRVYESSSTCAEVGRA